MPDTKDLHGRRLYDALIALKPDELAETDWAALAGLNRGFFSNLKANPEASPRLKSIRALLAHIGKTEADLDAGAPSAPTPPKRTTPVAVASGDAVPVISLDLSLSMGAGTLIEDFVEAEPVFMDLRLLQLITRTPSDRLRLVRGIGDSMEPTLRTGDQVLIDINDRQLTKIGGIYWIDYLGAHGIKRLFVVGKGRVRIASDNPIVPDIDVDSEDIRIEGRVIWYAREL